MVISKEELPLSVHSPLAAKVLGISEQCYRSLCRSGEIPAKHIGRRWIISRDRLMQYIDGGDADAK